jgi:hypothetical protein
MFGIFEAPHTSIGWSGSAGGGIPPGGFPGMFPTAGVSNSGWAGFNQATYDQWKKKCEERGECVMGPPPSLMGPRRI